MNVRIARFFLLTLLFVPFGYWLAAILRAALGMTGWGMVFRVPNVFGTLTIGVIGGCLAGFTLMNQKGEFNLARWPRLIAGLVAVILLFALPVLQRPGQLEALGRNVGRELIHFGLGIVLGLALYSWLDRAAVVFEPRRKIEEKATTPTTDL